MFQLIDFYAFTRTGAAIMAVCQCLAVGWIFGKKKPQSVSYVLQCFGTFIIIELEKHFCLSSFLNFLDKGADRFYNIIEEMTGTRPCFYFKLCWKYCIPVLTMVSRLFSSFTVDRIWGYGLVWLQQHDGVNPDAVIIIIM